MTAKNNHRNSFRSYNSFPSSAVSNRPCHQQQVTAPNETTVLLMPQRSIETMRSEQLRRLRQPPARGPQRTPRRRQPLLTPALLPLVPALVVGMVAMVVYLGVGVVTVVGTSSSRDSGTSAQQARILAVLEELDLTQDQLDRVLEQLLLNNKQPLVVREPQDRYANLEWSLLLARSKDKHKNEEEKLHHHHHHRHQQYQNKHADRFRQQYHHFLKHKTTQRVAPPPSILPPPPVSRCTWVLARFSERNAGTLPDDLESIYRTQSVNPNVFYRATAHIFWHDFVSGRWGSNLTQQLLQVHMDDADDTIQDPRDNVQEKELVHLKGVPLHPKSTWTWVTGDQHLSNFGAWRNRHGHVVFGVNDFDEAAIYDFQIDVLRIAVSVCSHAITNGMNDKQVTEALRVFLMSYVDSALVYDSSDAVLFELTPTTSSGRLAEFLWSVQQKKSSNKQMTKFTHVHPDTGQRQFRKGPVGMPNPKSRLASVPPDREQEIRSAFHSTLYGATMIKLGWAVHSTWDDHFFTVLDVAERVGSGVGSFGVDRYYVLLQGTDGLLGDDDTEGSAVILDVKYQPKSAVTRVLEQYSLDDAAWYNTMFRNEAARVTDAQRRLTSYTDPYIGWITLKNIDPADHNYGNDEPFTVRQRSPWKDSPDLDALTDPDDFNNFMAQIAVATATSHIRGTISKAPATFAEAMRALFMSDEDKVEQWTIMVSRLARAYREQVLLDFVCFKAYVQATYGGNNTR